MNKKIISNIIGKILLVFSLGFIVRKLIEYNVDWSEIITIKIIVAIVVSTMLHGLNIFCATFTFRSIVQMITGNNVRQSSVTKIYCKSNLYKYLPGNVMHFIGRNQLAIDEDLSHADVGLATVIELSSLALGGFIVSILCAYNYFIEYIRLVEVKWIMVAGIVSIGIVLALIVLFIVKEKIIKIFQKYRKLLIKQNIKVCVVVLSKSIMRLIANAIIFIGLMYAFDMEFSSASLTLVVLGIFVMSWVIGFLTPGAPGGLGVREFVMTVFLTGYFNEEILIVVLLVYRVICVLGDMISYGYAIIGSKYFLERE